MLYFRQILIMLVSLYTVRVVLNVLGEEDYGTYNVIAGVVVLFSFVNNAMATATQRFLNFYIGKKDLETTREVYSSSLIIHLGIALVFLILAETLGFWFVINKLNIPENRHQAALIVYQFTIVTTIFNIIKVPYNAVIIAYEKMSFYAEISILEAILKLVIVFLLKASSFDRLIVYGFLLTCISVIITVIFKFYCNYKFEIARFKKIKNFALAKEILSFSGWNLLGATANICNSQGTNMALNVYTNVVVNAAMGIANQVNSAVYSFVSNFQTAFNPQIVKSYAREDFKYLEKLIFITSKVSFFLLVYITIPLFLNSNYVLRIWLKTVPPYALHFVQLIIIWSLVDSFNGPLYIAVQATGKIKIYQIIISILIFLNLPISICLLHYGFDPAAVLYVRIVLNCVNVFFRVFYLSRIIGFSKKNYFFNVTCRSLIILLISFILSWLLYRVLCANELLCLFMTIIFSVFVTSLLVLVIGLNKDERKYGLDLIKRKIKRNE